jgi:hypothetical protein
MLAGFLAASPTKRKPADQFGKGIDDAVLRDGGEIACAGRAVNFMPQRPIGSAATFTPVGFQVLGFY